VAFAGSGVLLAGLSLAALLGYRRRQFRWRHPGRTISPTPPDVRHVERSLRTTGSVAQADVSWLDEALPSLAHTLSAGDGRRLPDVVAVAMTADRLQLVLTGPTDRPPAPWTADETGSRWSTGRDDPLPYEPQDRAYHFAPYPTLASVGDTAGGQQWLLDLERISALTLSGDPERCVNLARFLAAELAHNSWSEMLQVTLVSFGAELAPINPDRLTCTDDPDRVTAALAGQRDTVTAAMAEHQADVLTGRLHDIAGDAPAPHVLLIASAAAGETAGLDRLQGTLRAQPSRTAAALVLAEDPAQRPRSRRNHRLAAEYQHRRDAGNPGAGRAADRR